MVKGIYTNFSGGGGGGTSSGFATTVNTYADLPAASTLSGQDAQVLTTSGVPFVNRHVRGIYYSDGSTWIYVGPIASDEDTQLQVSATNRILGRFSSGAGAVEEISLGTGVSVSGGTLKAWGYSLLSYTDTRNAAGYITQVIYTAGPTFTFTRDSNNYVTSKTNGTNTWTYARDGSNRVTGVTVT